MNENAKAATELVKKNTSISVPVFIEDGYIHADTIFQGLEIYRWAFTGGRMEQTWDGCEGEDHGAVAWICPSITGYLQPFRRLIRSWDTLLDT